MKKILILVIVMFLLMFNLSSAEIIEADITHAWECDDNLQDATGNFTLVNIGSVNFSSGVKKLGSHSCDLTNDVNDYLVTNFLEYDDPHAISMWFYSDDWSATFYEVILSTNDTNAGNAMGDYSFSYVNSPSDQHLFLNAEATAGINNFGSWQHLVITYDGTSAYYYLNNTLITKFNGTPTSDKPMIFGRWATDLARAFDGYFDEMMQINKNISAAEVTQLWNNGDGLTLSDIVTVDSLNLSAASPANNTQFNTGDSGNLTFNVTANVSIKIDNIVSYWNFDQTNGILLDLVSGYDGTDNGVVKGFEGYFDKAYRFTKNSSVDVGDQTGFDVTGDFSVTAWVNVSKIGSFDTILAKKQLGGGSSGYALGLNGCVPFLEIGGNGTWEREVSGFGCSGTNFWGHYTWVYSSENNTVSYYRSGVFLEKDTFTSVTQLAENNLPVSLGNDRVSGFFDFGFNGTLDDIAFYDGILSDEQIKRMANASGVGERVNADSKFNCSLYFNDTINTTRNDILAGLNTLVDFNVTFPENLNESYEYFINCNDGVSNENTTENIIYIDNVDPSITWSYPSDLNNSVFNLGNTTTFTPNIILNDWSLHSYYYNITQLSTVISNFSNTSLGQIGTYTISDTTDLSDYLGVLTATTRVCDGHTANNIHFDARVSGKELVFNDGKIKVYPDNPNTVNLAGFNRMPDRYTFDFTTKTAMKVQTFWVTSDEYIDIIENSKYAGHLISGQNWLDFEIDDLKSVNVQRVSDNSVKVIVTLNNPKQYWHFQSIGELNCVQEDVEFYSFNTTETYEAEVLTTATTNFNLNITNYNSTWLGTPTANFTYNGTVYSPTITTSSNSYKFDVELTVPSLTAGANVTFNWTYSVQEVEYNTDNTQQEIFVPAIDNCSIYTTRFVNFTIRDELTLALLNSDIEYVFDFTSGSYTNNFNGTETGVNVSDFCVYPSWANFTTDMNIQYSAAGYDDRTYVVESFGVNNITTNITLYLLNSSESTEITIHVVDDQDKDLQNVVIEAFRYDIGTNSDILVSTESTDSDGNVKFNLKTGSESYSFKFYQGGDLKLSTTRFKLFSTEYTYILRDLIDSPLSEWINLQDIDSSLTYNNDTNLIQFNWSSSLDLADQFCLRVNGNDTVWFNQCSSSNSGSFNYTISTFNLTYAALGIVITTSGNEYQIKSLFIDTREKLTDIFGNGLVLLVNFIIFVSLSLLGIFNKNIAVVLGMVALVVLWLFALLPIGFGTLTGVLALGVLILIIINKK